MDFAGTVILITGASQGIGKTLASILHEYGATVIGVYHHTKIDDIYDTYQCDITKEEEVQKLINYVKEKHEKLDCLVNCAALSMDDDLYNKSKDDFMKVLDVNLGGTFLMCKYASLIMDRGVIVNMSSTDASLTYNPLAMDYCASKAGVENLTKTLAMRLSNLRICALAPNWVNTESVMAMEPSYLEEELKKWHQKRLLTKEEVALKIIEIILNDEYSSGSVIRMSGIDE